MAAINLPGEVQQAVTPSPVVAGVEVAVVSGAIVEVEAAVAAAVTGASQMEHLRPLPALLPAEAISRREAPCNPSYSTGLASFPAKGKLVCLPRCQETGLRPNRKRHRPISAP